MRYVSKDEVEYELAMLVRDKLPIKGRVYLSSQRNDSIAEDAVFVCTALILNGCEQEGVVNINIYIPHINDGRNVLVKDTGRVIEVSNMLKDVSDFLVLRNSRLSAERKGYVFFERTGIDSYVNEEKQETIVKNELNFKYYGRD